MVDRSVVSWNAMISAYGWNGLLVEAMKGIQPDKITFLGVLAACTHGGLVQQGRNYFHIGTRDFCWIGSRPEVLMVLCLLGRAGMFGEAMECVRTEHAELDLTVWGLGREAWRMFLQEIVVLGSE
ncbi:hypothetical protein MLD38_001757 [Melastoma candidum]|uniref:Uncharacterized protein n=1 Tax=Melastoma candidum TaxID=119954 RepID=A0ACB9SHK1_9MYRT|nr:hypothetical protein MLD38_001757 [Melastoma candidum]